MVLERERDIIKLFITETLRAFCKNHLAYSSQITIDGLVGVTIDQGNVILVTIKESIELADKAGIGYAEGVGPENLLSETSDPSFHFPSNDPKDVERRKSEERHCSTYNLASYRSPEIVPIKLESSSPFAEEAEKEGLPVASTGRPDYGLDLSLHARNQVKVIEPEGTRDDRADPGTTEGPSFNPGDIYPRCHGPLDEPGLGLSPDGKRVSGHFILPLFMTHHRTNFKKRKIQLLSNEPSNDRTLSSSAEGESCASRADEVKVKTERDSPGLDPKSARGEGTGSDQPEGDLGSSSAAGKNAMTGHQSNRWLGSGQLPWADFQNMLIKSWRRNHHEEMLLKPLAHALIESWTNLSDTGSHKRIGECVQAILLYEGRYVPVRDIQRLRLSSMTSQEIRSTMEFLNSTREGKVGCYREIRGGIGVFYKCPPHLVDLEFLESFGLTPAVYETRYASRMVSNATNRHSAVYWYRIETCSPYLTSTEVL